jgi:hypothetical protein
MISEIRLFLDKLTFILIMSILLLLILCKGFILDKRDMLLARIRK